VGAGQNQNKSYLDHEANLLHLNSKLMMYETKIKLVIYETESNLIDVIHEYWYTTA